MSSGGHYQYRNEAAMELEDGRELRVVWYGTWITSGHPENDGDVKYYIDDEEVDRGDLPAEITEEVLTNLERNAR